MKKIKVILSILIVALVLSSCSLYLTQGEVIEMDNLTYNKKNKKRR